jgi:hypothetical protein
MMMSDDELTEWCDERRQDNWPPRLLADLEADPALGVPGQDVVEPEKKEEHHEDEGEHGD